MTGAEAQGILTVKGSIDDHQPLIILKSSEKHNPVLLSLLAKPTVKINLCTQM